MENSAVGVEDDWLDHRIAEEALQRIGWDMEPIRGILNRRCVGAMGCGFDVAVQVDDGACDAGPAGGASFDE